MFRFPLDQKVFMLEKICTNLYRFKDTCWVYVIQSGDEAVLIDFGDGDVLAHLAQIGVRRVTDVLMTHHHRDQGEGLPRAIAHGARVWVPYVEQDLFTQVNWNWQSRELLNNYNMRQDRFSLIEPLAQVETLRDYRQYTFGEHTFKVLPTPGHTTGSITLMVEIEARTYAFTGDLIAGPGKLWSLAATQWTYNGGEGLPLTVASVTDLKARQPDCLLPSHGEMITEPGPAIDLLVARCTELMALRRQNPRLSRFLAKPYEALTPHLLRNRTSMANSYVLRSDSGKAMVIDFGYDFIAGMAPGADRAAHRPWLYTLPQLKRDWDVQSIDVVMPTHYHDDHVAGINLLRDVEGAQSWVAENFAHILQKPASYNLPCLWFDPIPVDRVLPIGAPFTWEEYTFRLHHLPGHTQYAVAIEVEVDGKRVLFSGDQHRDNDGLLWNYVYQNGLRTGDTQRAARLYETLRPDLILSGHWEPTWVQDGYFEKIKETSAQLERLHNELLPDEIAGFGPEGFGAYLEPYQVFVQPGQAFQVTMHVRNPFNVPAVTATRLVTPDGWQVEPAAQSAALEPHAQAALNFAVQPPQGLHVRRALLAAELTANGQKFGQQAEMFITVE